jgi:hypothetical protein
MVTKKNIDRKERYESHIKNNTDLF